MPGPAPKPNRRRRNAPIRGEMQPAEGQKWLGGPVPEPPDGLLAASKAAWATWFGSWWASNWSNDDLPGLRVVIQAYDAVQRANPPKANDLTALVRLMDTYGITPAGQQARRWAPPRAEEPAKPAETAEEPQPSRYRHLRAV